MMMRDIAKDLCVQHNISLDSIRNHNKTQRIMDIRRELIYALKNDGHSNSEISRFLNRKPSSITSLFRNAALKEAKRCEHSI